MGVNMIYENDTIAAITTGLTESGVGIIRVSGEDSIDIVSRIFVNKYGKHRIKEKASHTISFGYIIDIQNNLKCNKLADCATEEAEEYSSKSAVSSEGEWKKNIIDEVMVSVFKAPLSYTTENTVEINCHGGVLVMKTILDLVLRNGARIAAPGEFTKRAFLNGRIDLSKAEAVMDLIHSQSKMAMDASLKQLNGSVYRKIKEMREQIIYEIAFIESALDDPEHISLEGYQERIAEKVNSLLIEINKMILSSKSGILQREGINTAIIGRPNAGKSSVMNVLLHEDRAIVTDIAGTTRDVLKEYIQIGEIGLHIIDTAGIRDTEDAVEKIGVQKAKDMIAEADLILHVIDSSDKINEFEKEIQSEIGDKSVIVLLNKSDLNSEISVEDVQKLYGHDYVRIIQFSAKEKSGVDELENQIKEIFFAGEVKADTEAPITNIRHKNLLEDAKDSLSMVKRSIEDDMPEDFLSIDLMSAYDSLGKIIGEEIEDDLMEEIFTKFCMGK